MKFLLPLLLAFNVQAQTWYDYDPAARWPFASDSSYTRDAYHWWVKNTQPVCHLWLNGIPNGQETGSWSLNLDQCWPLAGDCSAIKVAVIDQTGNHSERSLELVRRCAPGVQAQLFPIMRFYPEQVAPAFQAAISWGANVINLSAAVINCGEPPNDGGLFQIIRDAQVQNGLVIVSCAVPNANYCICTNKDFPSSWAGRIYNIMPASAGYMNGTRITNPGAAYGERVLLWPGRNIVAQGQYTSGTSEAASIQSGVCALMLAQVNRTVGVPVGDLVLQGLRDFAVTTGNTFTPPLANPLDAMLNWNPDFWTYQKWPTTEP